MQCVKMRCGMCSKQFPNNAHHYVIEMWSKYAENHEQTENNRCTGAYIKTHTSVLLSRKPLSLLPTFGPLLKTDTSKQNGN